MHPMAFDQEFWDERYRAHDSIWSGNPNRHLVGETAELVPGAALDVGCGEGADAIWLAARGWRVTAADISAVALERAATRAAAAGDGIAERIDWLHQDLATWEPGAARYDLVSAQYLHLPVAPRDELFGNLAAAVAPGGTLLIVGHHPSDLQTTVPRPPMPELFYTADDVAESLDPDEWQIVTRTAPGRPFTDPDGLEVTVHDAVLRALRRG